MSLLRSFSVLVVSFWCASWATACAPAADCEVTTCSDDGTELWLCDGGERQVVDCLGAYGQLCEAGACVDPWRYGSPEWSSCPADPLATEASLLAKAAGYDEIARRLHIQPDLGWAMNVVLPGQSIACPPGETPPCYDPVEPAIAPSEATYADVAEWQSGENDGLWSALYLTSQAYRYAVTGSAEALETIRLLLAGEVTRMAITGVPGIFTRQLVVPGVAGLACPEDDAAYTTDVEKDDNRWVRIADDGCVWVVDHEVGAWTATSHCGLAEYAGYCWLDNVSKDEYAGHMLALGALYLLVDEPDVQATVIDLLGQVGRHLADNELQLIDWDGRPTEHGRFSPLGLDDFPGFNAAMATSFLGMAARATGDPELLQLFDQCLLQREEGCSLAGLPAGKPFASYLPAAGMYIGFEGCGSNYNNISMHLLSLNHLIWFARDRQLRAAAQQSLDVDVMRPEGEPRAISGQHNALFDFIWAAHKRLGPGSDGPAYEAVEDGVCMLKQFPEHKAQPDLTLPAEYQPYCKNRFDDDVAEHPRQVAERCPATFLWWGDPYSLATCTRNDRYIRQPGDYLLAYWYGRYHGFIDPEL